MNAIVYLYFAGIVIMFVLAVYCQYKLNSETEESRDIKEQSLND